MAGSCKVALEKLLSSLESFKGTYGRHLREVAAKAREVGIRAAEADRSGADTLTAMFESVGPVWLPGRILPAERDVVDDVLASPAKPRSPIWFRSDSVRYSVVRDAEGQPSELAFSVDSEDMARWEAWARATDRRGDREYEVSTSAALRGRPGYMWSDRTHSVVVPAPWVRTGDEAKIMSIPGHGMDNVVMVKIETGVNRFETPMDHLIGMNAHTFGTLLSTLPEFWWIATLRGGDLVITNCDLGSFPSAPHIPRILHESGFGGQIHIATGPTLTQATNPDGTLQARDIPGKYGPEWDPEPTRSTILVEDGAFSTFKPPRSADNGAAGP